MQVVSAQLRDFRTYARAEASLGAGLTVVHGANGAGKSNLLEALYFGCTGRSQRTRNDRELIRFGAQTARVELIVSDGERQHRLAVGVSAGAEKHMSVDGVRVQQLVDAPQRPLVSVFSPDRLDLIKGPPALRRAHLDRLVAALWPARRQARVDYARVLAQRNALLTGIRAGRASRSTLPSWDLELARHALALRDHRGELVRQLSRPFGARAGQLGVSGECELRYRPRTNAADARELADELAARLDFDLQRGFSTHGPHRDELSISRDGRELRTFGSQGEQRLALLALLLAERSLLAQERGDTPLMLLDDVMSELDAPRRELLIGELASGGQSVIATTDLAHVPGALAPDVTRLAVSPGVLAQEAAAA